MMRMNCPAGLAVDKRGNFLVADEGSNRLLVLDWSLNSAHEMPCVCQRKSERTIQFVV